MTHRILLVDDYPVVREGLKRLLGLPGVAICGEASNGKEALERVATLKPDLVVMDLTMPEMNGIEATKEIRRRFPNTRIIVVSLHDSARATPLAKQAGADAYVQKTSSAEEFIDTVQAVLGVDGLRKHRTASQASKRKSHAR